MLLPYWVLAAFGMAAFAIIWVTLRMMRSGADRPIARWRESAVRNRRALIMATVGIIVTGLNMITFMWLKPVLNYLVPFRADVLLADADRMLFFTDPWRLVTWLDTWPMAILYHRGWFALMILILLKVLLGPPSRQKTAILLTYFLLWSVYGPLVHVLLPAGGPVFYERLGYGDTFGALALPVETREMADYLWRAYSTRSFAPGSGISAMPSLHIATTAWMVIATYVFARRWVVPMSLTAFLIFVLSVALGWHYAVDGIVGAISAWVIWKACEWRLAKTDCGSTVESGLRGTIPA
jgi:hypothetical protein